VTATATRYRGRFAPSPTGDLHLGGARTALVAWLAARAAGGALVLRVEDLDRARAVPGATERILEDLRWLGLVWDEGPFVQSERTSLYAEAVARLMRAGRAFECFCSRAEVARAATAPHGPSDDGPRYPGTCRGLTAEERVARRAAGRRPSVRFLVNQDTVTWVDRVYGEARDRVDEQVGDFVIVRADGVFAYQLAVVVDDIAMGITEVVRGDDLRGSTARQILVYRALGATPPGWLHVPLVLGPDGARLSKRHGAIGVRALREAGASPERVIGRLAETLGLAAPGEAIDAASLVARFDPARLPRTPTVLDPARFG
jgi:glutamyl-tRNA synthetase